MYVEALATYRLALQAAPAVGLDPARLAARGPEPFLTGRAVADADSPEGRPACELRGGGEAGEEAWGASGGGAAAGGGAGAGRVRDVRSGAEVGGTPGWPVARLGCGAFSGGGLVGAWGRAPRRARAALCARAVLAAVPGGGRRVLLAPLSAAERRAGGRSCGSGGGSVDGDAEASLADEPEAPAGAAPTSARRAGRAKGKRSGGGGKAENAAAASSVDEAAEGAASDGTAASERAPAKRVAREAARLEPVLPASLAGKAPAGGARRKGGGAAAGRRAGGAAQEETDAPSPPAAPPSVTEPEAEEASEGEESQPLEPQAAAAAGGGWVAAQAGALLGSEAERREAVADATERLTRSLAEQVGACAGDTHLGWLQVLAWRW